MRLRAGVWVESETVTYESVSSGMNNMVQNPSGGHPRKSLHEMKKDESLAGTFLRATTAVMVFLTLAGAFWAGLFPIRSDQDPWWHLKTGQVLWEHFAENGFDFPEYDVFTYTGEETPWVNHEWLADLIFYAAYRVGGLQGAILLKSLILCLTFALLMLYMVRNGVGWKMACLGSIIALLASHGSLALRPPVFTYLFIVIFLHFILSFQLGEYFRQSFIGLVLGEIIWINLHGGAVIGILLVFFWWISELWFCLITWLKENPTAPSFKRLGTSTIVLLAVGVASLLNPWGYEVHLLPSKVMGDWWLVYNIGELQSPNMHFNRSYEFIILGLLMLPMMRAGSIWIYEGLAIVFFAHQSLNYVRHIPLFALVAVPPLIAALAEERNSLIPPMVQVKDRVETIWLKLESSVRWIMKNHIDVIVAFLVFAYIFGLRPGKIWVRNAHDFSTFITDGYVKEAFPVNAVDFIQRFNIPGPMFNHDNFAGYLIWRLSPEHMKLFTDSRYDLWGSVYAKEEMAVFAAYQEPLGAYDEEGNWYEYSIITANRWERFFPELVNWQKQGGPYWQYVLDKYDANFIISFEGYSIDRLLRREFRGWYLIYDDVMKYERPGGYVIYLRDKPENLPLIRELALLHREHIPSVAEENQ